MNNAFSPTQSTLTIRHVANRTRVLGCTLAFYNTKRFNVESPTVKPSCYVQSRSRLSLATQVSTSSVATCLSVWRILMTSARSASDSWRDLFRRRMRFFSAFLNSFVSFLRSSRCFVCSAFKRSMSFKRSVVAAGDCCCCCCCSASAPLPLSWRPGAHPSPLLPLR